MKIHCLEVTGDFACFTRPEMKVERVSYDVITPSSARAIFEAILWKPAMRWHISKIEVLNPIRWINLRRNEVGAVVSERNVKTAIKKGEGNLTLYIETERQQRAALFLRDVKYRIHGYFELLDPRGGNTAVKFSEMFERRARKGQCFNQPYLGTREFSCSFRPIDSESELSQPIRESRDLGWMLYDMDFYNPDNPTPRFFHTRMNDGVVDVPAWDSEEVRG